MNRNIILSLAAFITLSANAINVTCDVPGTLSTLVANPATETSLTVGGHIDARDFLFIAEQMPKLSTLNLSNAKIEAYSSDKPVFANLTDYATDEVPTMALACKTALTSVTLPASATRIGEGAFAGCTKISSLTLPAALEQLGDYAFAGCTSLRQANFYPAIRVIGKGAFKNCTELTKSGVSSTPANLVEICDEAFMGCKKLTSFTFNGKIGSIGNEAFAYSGMQTVTLYENQALTSLGDFAYCGAPLQTANFPSSVVTIGKGMLMYTPLNTVTLPQRVTLLPDYLLAGDDAVTRLTLGNDIQTIGEAAFYEMSGITQLTLPASLQHIGANAMAGMTGLERISIKATAVPTLGEDVWLAVDQPSVTLAVPQQAISQYQAAEQWKRFIIEADGIPGDIDHNGIVDVGDLSLIIDYMVGLSPTPFDFAAADLTGDNIIDVSDMNLLLNIILSTTNASPVVPEPNTDDILFIDDFTIDDGETRTIEVRLNNSVDYDALQGVIHLPEGLTAVEGSLKTTQRSEGHTIAALNDNGDITILLYSMLSDALTGEPGDAVLTLQVKAGQSLDEAATVTIDHVAMAGNGVLNYAMPTQALVSRTSALRDVTTQDKVYASGGTLYIIASDGGMADIVAANGMTQTIGVNAGMNTYDRLNPGLYIIRLAGKSHKVVIR